MCPPFSRIPRSLPGSLSISQGVQCTGLKWLILFHETNDVMHVQVYLGELTISPPQYFMQLFITARKL